MAEEAKKEVKVNPTLGIIGMVCGIIAAVCCWIPFFGLVCGIAAIILSILFLKKKPASKGFSIAGIITGAIGVVVSAITTIGAIAAIVAGNAVLNELNNELNNSGLNNFKVEGILELGEETQKCMAENGYPQVKTYDDLDKYDGAYEVWWDC